MSKVLAVNLNYLGDALFTTAALDVLRRRDPSGRIDALVGPRAQAVLAGHPSVTRLHIRPSGTALRRVLFLTALLRRERYDRVYFFHSTLVGALAARLMGVTERIGFAVEGAAPLLTRAIPPRADGEHHVHGYLRLVDAIESHTPRRLSLAIGAEDRAYADALLHVHEVTPPIVGLAIGATRPQKRWPEAHFARLADRLWNTGGVSCLLLGGPGDEESARRILEQARSPLVSVVGKTSVKQLAAICSRLGVIVSADSGPLHIATAMGAPVVALFGSTDPRETGPWGGTPSLTLYDALPCAPCRKSPTCDNRFDCLTNLLPERVFDAVASLLPDHNFRRLPLPLLEPNP